MVNYTIETFDLTKIYKLKGHKSIYALNNANIKVKEGEIFGLLGPNGAGKTTMVQILTTLLQPTEGYALVNGYNILENPNKIKKNIGLMLGASMVYFRITGYDNLKFFCKIYNIPNYKERIIETAKLFNLENWLNQYVEKYSLGMKLKLSFCRALLMDPPILFLDEPTLGLDVSTTLFVIDMLKKFDKTIFLTSHNMHVIEKLCDRIAFIENGSILKVGTQEELKKLMQLELKIKIEIKDNKSQLIKELDQKDFVSDISESNEGLIFTLNNKQNYYKLFSVLSNHKSIQKIQEQDITLDNLFLKKIKS